MASNDNANTLDRRQFLAGVRTALIISSTALIHPAEAWGLEVKNLKPETMRTLIKMARDIYPHDRLADRFYAVAMKGYDEKAGTDPADQDHGRDTALPARRARPKEARRCLCRRRLGGRARRAAAPDRDEPFFQNVRGGLVVSLYNQKEVWPVVRLRGRIRLEGRLHQPRLRRHHVALATRADHTIRRSPMAAKFDLNDDSVVVIIGSGAGGGTLANELAQKGIKVVMLEAGPRHEIEDFVNDEWESFGQLAWLDMRTTSGSWRVHRDFPEPAGLDRQGRRRHNHALGGRVAALPGARVQGPHRLRRHPGRQPARLADHA